MAGIDKAAIAFSIAIAVIGVGVAFYSGSVQDTPDVSTPVDTKNAPEIQPTGEEMVKQEAPIKTLKDGWERITSVTDPGLGHETHQLAVILAPSDKVYSGTLQYDASEPIQLVSLVGPLKEGEAKGQAIWTPDGKTKFALIFVDPKNAAGEWKFAGNALAVHTMKTTPFTVDYKVDYKENPISSTVMTGTIQSVQDPGVGHEAHQLAVILAPSSDMYSGILSYSASEDIQLVSLRGPISANEKPAQIWTPDGKTIFELTFIDPKNAVGSWEFKGNALAVHTMNTNPFTVSYAVSATASKSDGMMMEPKTDGMMMEPKPSEPSKTTGPQKVSVAIPTGTSSQGCEATSECYLPDSVTINVGDSVEWTNIDAAAHTVTSGSLAEGPSGAFNSGLIMGKAVFSHTFDNAGSYDYFCMVHPWMTGSVKVN